MSHVENTISDQDVGRKPRILIVEDSSLIAAKVAQILKQHGYGVVGPAATLAQGLELAQGDVDAAVLDIDLRGKAVYELAEVLHKRGTPFMFLTGYHRQAVPNVWRTIPRVEKPFDDPLLLSAVQDLFTGPIVGFPPGPGADDPSSAESATFRLIREGRNLAMESRILRDEVSATIATGARRPR